MPRAVPRNRADEFEEQEIVKGNKLRMVFGRAFKEMYENLAVTKVADKPKSGGSKKKSKP